MMTDYKELVSDLKYYAEHPYLWVDAQVEGIKAAADAIEQLVKDIDVLTKECDRAIGELRSIGDNCFCCRWWEDEPSDGDWSHNHCSCPDTCCADGNPDRWEWRGLPDE